MKVVDLTVEIAERFGKYCKVVLRGDFEPSLPGQFYMLKGDWGYDPLLPRPISVMDENLKEGKISFLIKNVGEGSRRLFELKKGDKVFGTGPSGNSFPIDKISKRDFVAIVGGGVGVPPLYYLLKKLNEKGIKPHFFEGARTKKDLILKSEIKNLNCDLELATEDGSCGKKGFVTELLKEINPDFVFACGPYGMLKAIARTFDKQSINCYVSLEERMACGYGICLGCAVKTYDEKRDEHFERICVEGPIFDSKRVKWL